MKRILSPIIAFLLFFAAPVGIIKAQSSDFTLDKNSTVTQNPYFAAGQNTNISGIVNGDAFVAGGQIAVDGTINGDLRVVGGNIRVTGDVTGNIVIAGGQLSLSGTVGKNLIIMGGNVDVASSASIKGYLIGTGGNITVNAPINGNADFAAGNVTLNDSVGGNVQAKVGQLTLGSNADIKGDLTYWSQNEAVENSGAKVEGETTKHIIPQTSTQAPSINKTNVLHAFEGLAIGTRIIALISTLAIGFLMIAFFPNFMEKTAQIINKNPWKSAGLGFLAIIVFPIGFVILLITIIGIPVALILAAFWAIYLYISKIFVIYWLTQKITKPSNSKYLYFFFSAIIYFAITLIPFFSGLARFIVAIVGLGALIMSCKAFLQESKKANLI